MPSSGPPSASLLRRPVGQALKQIPKAHPGSKVSTIPKTGPDIFSVEKPTTTTSRPWTSSRRRMRRHIRFRSSPEHVERFSAPSRPRRRTQALSCDDCLWPEEVLKTKNYLNLCSNFRILPFELPILVITRSIPAPGSAAIIMRYIGIGRCW